MLNFSSKGLKCDNTLRIIMCLFVEKCFDLLWRCATKSSPIHQNQHFWNEQFGVWRTTTHMPWFNSFCSADLCHLIPPSNLRNLKWETFLISSTLSERVWCNGANHYKLSTPQIKLTSLSLNMGTKVGIWIPTIWIPNFLKFEFQMVRYSIGRFICYVLSARQTIWILDQYIRK